MLKSIRIKRGLNIKLNGESQKAFAGEYMPDTFAIAPVDFPNARLKLAVKEGHKVQVGSPLLFDKDREQILFTSPVSGEVLAINRGMKRAILEVVVKSDNTMDYLDFGTADPAAASREEITGKLLQSGLWPCIRQRPYNRIANPSDQPLAIYISAFDSSPLAPDMDFFIKGKKESLQTGIDVLSRLLGGEIQLSIHKDLNDETFYKNLVNINLHSFSGPHPSGNIGIQIHHIQPLNKGDIVWHCDIQDVCNIGYLFKEGIYKAERGFNLTGSEIIPAHRKYYKTLLGANIHNLLQNKIQESNIRIISGNVLTGKKIEKHNFLGFYDHQITVIPEGNYYELLGWITPGFKKFSTSRTFFSWLNPQKKYNLDTHLHGGKRALIMSGEYEKVLPMDIYPLHLIKAIMIQDIDLMEKLGIYEVAPEDFALCEFVCTSKVNLQEIVQNGIDLMIKEME